MFLVDVDRALVLAEVLAGLRCGFLGLDHLHQLFTLLLGPLPRLAIGGSIALSVLMIPIVVRNTEDVRRVRNYASVR